MTLRHMRVFVAVCTYKSITTAAEKLYLAQPTVSLAIRELENYYGVRLFDRISRKLYLTEIGEQVLSYASHIVSLFDEMDTKIRNWDSTGTLRIGASITAGTYLLPKYVSLFRESHPHITVQAIIENSEDLEHRILANDLDFAIIEGAVHNVQLRSKKIMEDELVLICGKTHPLFDKESIAIDRLPDYDFILRENGSGARELFDSTLLTYSIAIRPIWESVSTHAIINAVSEGLGLSVLPRRMVQSDLDAGHVRSVKIQDVHFRRPLSIIYHKNKFVTDSAKEFMALCETEIETIQERPCHPPRR